jgi:peptidoglycan/LPS O-acetylase OafA/YrhL
MPAKSSGKARSPTKKVEEIAALTSLRGIAAMAVLLLHFRDQFGSAINPDHLTLFFARSYLFVDFFFVLSGFVIALSYGHMFARTVTPSDYMAFLVRRLARIYPLHFVVLMGFVVSEFAKYAVATNANPPFSVNTVPALIANLFLVQSWGWFTYYTWNHPAWSISTEWFAYILFPLLAFGLLRLRGWPQATFVIVACIAVLQVFYAIPADIQPGFFLLRCLPSFTLGILVYRIPAFCSQRAIKFFAQDAVFGIALVVAFLCVACPCPDLVSVASFCSVVLAGSLNRGAVSRGLSIPPIYFLGLISYSIYLVHTLVLRVWQMLFQVVWHSHMSWGAALAALVILIASVLIASTLSFYYIEAPGRTYFGRFARRNAYEATTVASVNEQEVA